MDSLVNRNNICVVHLVRQCNGLEPFRKFISSYIKHEAGISHTLLLLFKGFNEHSEISEYEELLENIGYEKMFVNDEGFDIGSYMFAFNKNKDKFTYFCFLNSFSEILISNWLVKLYDNLQVEGVGLVGASGSTQSLLSEQSFRNARFDLIQGITSKLCAVIVTGIKICITKCIYVFFYDPYPNYHIRSNVFMIKGNILEKIHCQELKIKRDALRFESGKKSLTIQVLKLGLRTIVVDHEGEPYEKEDWHKSNTFWQGNQENLLVADNQTRSYQQGDNKFRCFLSRLAWRHDSRPCLNDEPAK